MLDCQMGMTIRYGGCKQIMVLTTIETMFVIYYQKNMMGIYWFPADVPFIQFG